MTDKPHAAGVMFQLADGRVLFLERSDDTRDHPRKWCFPGGGIDAGETPKVAARREVLEEVGQRVDRLGAPVDHRSGFVTFRVQRGGPFDPVLNDEHTRAVWAHPDEAPQPLHPGVAATLDKMRQRARGPRYQCGGVRITAAGRRNMALDVKGTLDPIRPALPTQIEYQRRVDALVDDMSASLLYWLRAAYRANTPATVELAQDSAAGILQAAFDKLSARWLRKFDDLSFSLSRWFAAGSKERVDRLMKQGLRKAGFTVRFTMTRPMRDAFDAVVDENIGLIKSIGEQHLANVRVALNQSVQNGRDLGYLTDQLEKRTGITKRRAAFIARDQNNKATAVMVRTRAIEAGITKGLWLHSAGGKEPRPEHVAFSGQQFDLRKGHDFDNGEGIVWPGTAINCRCVMRPVVPGFE
jgi:Uncharacterized protein, homolog of phage Mu protein gp30